MKNKGIKRNINLLTGLLLLIIFCMSAQISLAEETRETSTAQPQTDKISVSGVVTDENGAPVIGASVVVNGTTIGTTTDNKGKFILNAPANGTLTVSFMGYNTVQMEIAGKKTITVQLKSGVMMQEVVVAALGVKRDEKALGYAVQKVDGKMLQTVKGVDMASSLTGKVSGLVVKNSTEFNGQPVLEMRGETPLLVINGVPYGNMTLRDIAADDIENISMLKGATAAALYGARGSAGAIMVTTKGAKGQGLAVDINSNTMFTAGYLAIPKAQSSYGHGINGKISDDYVWGPKLDIGNTAMQWNPKTKKMEDMPLVSSGKDNLRNFMQTGVITNNSISISQTGEKGYFRTSLNHVYNRGQFPNQKLNIFNYSLSGQIKVGDKFTLESQMGYSRTTAPQTWGWGYDKQGYVYQIVMWTGPDYDIRDYRDYWVKPNEKQNWLYESWYDNPYMIAYEKLHSIERNKLNASLNANYEILPTLKATFRLGFDSFKDEDEVRNPAGVNSTRGPVIQRLNNPGGSTWGFSGKGMYGMNQNWGNSINGDFILNYNEDFGKFNVDALGGGSIFYSQQREQGSRTANGLAVPGWYSLANAVPSKAAGIDAIQTNYGNFQRQVNSIYAKLSLSWNNAVFVDATGRNDWSSTQSKDERSYFYPSVASSVVLSEFFNTPKWLSMWKVRGSWTITKSPLGIYDNNTSYQVESSWGGSSASLPDNLLGTNLLPSESRTWEVGTSAYFFGRRLQLDVAYFAKLYYHQQIKQKIAQSSGFANTLINTDETYARRGFEITVSGTPVKNKHFEWNSILNLSADHRYFVDIDPEYSSKNQWTAEGKRYDYYTRDEKILRDPQGNWIHGADGRVMLDTYQRLYGYQDPDISFGFINTFTLGNWTMGVSFDGRFGGLLDNHLHGKMIDTGSAPETDNQYRYDEVVNGKKYIGQGVKIVSGNVKYDSQGNILSDTRQYAPNDIPVSYQAYMQLAGNSWEKRIRNKSFFKLREVSIEYRIPSVIVNKIGMKTASVALTGNNLLLWTKDFKYSDPDLDKEDLNAPSQRMIGVNIKIGF